MKFFFLSFFFFYLSLVITQCCSTIRPVVQSSRTSHDDADAGRSERATHYHGHRRVNTHTHAQVCAALLDGRRPFFPPRSAVGHAPLDKTHTDRRTGGRAREHYYVTH